MNASPALQLNHWLSGLGVSDEELEARAQWLCGDHPKLPGPVLHYFELSASALRLTRYDQHLLTYVFLQAVIGLENQLRIHCGEQDQELKLKQMLRKAVTDGVIVDEVFSDIAPLQESHLKGLKPRLTKRPEKLADLVPELRNCIVHGNYILTPELLPLTLQVRRMVDAVARAMAERRDAGSGMSQR